MQSLREGFVSGELVDGVIPELVDSDSSAPVTRCQVILVEHMEHTIQHVGFELLDHAFIGKRRFEFKDTNIMLEERIGARRDREHDALLVWSCVIQEDVASTDPHVGAEVPTTPCRKV